MAGGAPGVLMQGQREMPCGAGMVWGPGSQKGLGHWQGQQGRGDELKLAGRAPCQGRGGSHYVPGSSLRLLQLLPLAHPALPVVGELEGPAWLGEEGAALVGQGPAQGLNVGLRSRGRGLRTMS